MKMNAPENRLMAIHIDEEFRSLIPPLAAEELAQLEANILAEGCRDALVLWDDVLIDGHNRYALCLKHGIPFETVQTTTIKTYDDAVLWIVTNQLGRRNITDFVRGELALRAKPIIEERAKERQIATRIKDGVTVAQNSAGPEESDSTVRPNSDEPAIRTDALVAKQAGVGKDTIRKIEKIKKTAAPEVLASVRSGEISIDAAAQVATLPAKKQAEVAAAGPAEVKKVAAEIRAAAKADPKLAPEQPKHTVAELLAENAELHDRMAEMQDMLKQTISDNEMMGRVFDADDKLKAAMAEATRYKALAENAERALFGRTNEFNERAKALQYWQNQAKKFKKLLDKVQVTQ